MKKVTFFLLVVALPFFINYAHGQKLELWYDAPAKEWTQALPLGNGRLGAMFYGGIEMEKIQLNESSLYSGHPIPDTINPQAFQYLTPIRKALLEHQDYTTAEKLAHKMQGLYTESYMPMGDIIIHQNFNRKNPKISNYKRSLDISTAIASTSFKADGILYQREMFISSVDSIYIIRLKSSKSGTINLDINLNSLLQSTISNLGNDQIIMSGNAPAHVAPIYYNPKGQQPIIYLDSNGHKGMRFQYRVKVKQKDGESTYYQNALHIKKATDITIYISAATSFNGFDKYPDIDGLNEASISQKRLESAYSKSYSNLKNRHLSDYQGLFNRVHFHIQDSTQKEGSLNLLPTNKRLLAHSEGKYDPTLEVLYFQYGRYLLISASRVGGPPANLQGIWNSELRAPWSSNYTININTQMNYWPVESTNLSELHEPLLNFIGNLTITGGRIAKEFYHANGWVAHHNSDIWGTANPVGNKGDGNPVWANWPMGGNWLSRHLWEHYGYTKDQEFLNKQAYPILKSAALFTLDWLVKDPQSGYYVTAPSTSPENLFLDSSGKKQSVSVATTMDMSIIRDLFDNVIEASKILNKDSIFRQKLEIYRAQLYPFKIGKNGQLLEWYKDFEETDIHHRHISHLYGLYPGTEINPETPKYFDAAKKTLEIRGDEGTGWSKSWKINWWARLLNGDHAHQLLVDLMRYTGPESTWKGGGTYPNMLDAHPPFQIDGNFAGTAGIVEMLLQSQNNQIFLLPALPSIWASGNIEGLVARGNFVINMDWKNSQLNQVKVISRSGGKCVLKTKQSLKSSKLKMVSKFDKGFYITTFETEKNQVYNLHT